MANTIVRNSYTDGKSQFQRLWKTVWPVKATIADQDVITSNVASGGKVAQIQTGVNTSYETSSLDIPFDDTIPQNSEGYEVVTTTITPTNASSVLHIDCSISIRSSSGPLSIALFRDSGADALGVITQNDGNVLTTVSGHWIISAGSTSETTFKIRAGGESGSVFINGTSGRLYGGVCECRLTVTELTP